MAKDEQYKNIVRFKAEIKESKMTKKGLDRIYETKLITDNVELNKLGEIEPDQTVDVVIGW